MTTSEMILLLRRDPNVMGGTPVANRIADRLENFESYKQDVQNYISILSEMTKVACENEVSVDERLSAGWFDCMYVLYLVIIDRIKEVGVID